MRRGRKVCKITGLSSVSVCKSYKWCPGHIKQVACKDVVNIHGHSRLSHCLCQFTSTYSPQNVIWAVLSMHLPASSTPDKSRVHDSSGETGLFSLSQCVVTCQPIINMSQQVMYTWCTHDAGDAGYGLTIYCIRACAGKLLPFAFPLSPLKDVSSQWAQSQFSWRIISKRPAYTVDTRDAPSVRVKSFLQ